MKILEIKTVNLGGEDIHTITHQEGWDFRKTSNETGYVRWVSTPELREDCIYLRGLNTHIDFALMKGEIDFNKITDFFNSKETPIVLKINKKFIGDFDYVDFIKLSKYFSKSYAVEKDEHIIKKLYLYEFNPDKEEETLLTVKRNGEVITHPSLKQEELDYLLENFSFFKNPTKTVVMEQKEKFDEDTKIGTKLTTWYVK